MNNYKPTKVLSKVAIIFLIAVFGIVGIISCAADATEPNASESSVNPDPDKTGPVTPEPGDTNVTPEPGDTNVTPEPGDTNVEPEPPQPTFPEDTYYTVYTPFRGENYPKVSYEDTNTLLRYWKEMIGIKDNGSRSVRDALSGGDDSGNSGGNGSVNGKRWYIRDGDYDYQHNPKNVHHYYFDKNFDLVYHRLGKGTLKIRKLVGAVIMKYYRGKYPNTLTVGGLYQNLIDNAGQYGWTHFSKFMHAGYNGENNNDYRKVGDLEILVLNLGFNDQNFDRFGVDSYYGTWNDYRTDINKFLGQSPESLESSSGGRLNVNQRVNLTYNPGAHNFWFMTAQPEAWELEEHPEGDWVQR